MTGVSGKRIEELLAASRKIRQDKATSIFENLSEHEQKLVKEAAVAGYMARFMSFSEVGEPVPSDSEMTLSSLHIVADHPDLYPTVSGYTPPED